MSTYNGYTESKEQIERRKYLISLGLYGKNRVKVMKLIGERANELSKVKKAGVK